MNKSKILTIVLTFVTLMIIIIAHIAITQVLISTANTSPIINLKDTDANTIAEVSSTATTEDNKKTTDDKIAVTSRSGKHEPLQENAQATAAEAPKAEAAAPATEVPVEEPAKPAEEVIPEPVEEPKPSYEGVELQYSAPYHITSARLSKSKGVVYYKGHKETYYSQKVLSGKGLKKLNNNGRHVADDGTVRDGDGYIAVACNYLSKGSRIMTSLGPGKVYDTGGMTGKWIDIYVNW